MTTHENNEDINVEDSDTKIIVNPYNFNNCLITEKDIVEIFSEFDLDYTPMDISLYQKAFTHKSYTKKKLEELDEGTEIVEKPEGALPLMDYDNERLEFLGDSILSPIVAKYLFERFPDQDEGFMTRLRTRLVNGETLGAFAKEMGFGKFIIISRHIEDKCNGRTSVKLLEDCFEAFFGAMYLDFNNPIDGSSIRKEYSNVYDNFYSGVAFQICEELFINIIEEKIDFAELILNDYNYKDQLLRYYQKTFHKPPKYKYVNMEGEPNSRVFTMAVLDIDENIITIGTGNSKKKAEQDAAHNALIHFNILD